MTTKDAKLPRREQVLVNGIEIELMESMLCLIPMTAKELSPKTFSFLTFYFTFLAVMTTS